LAIKHTDGSEVHYEPIEQSVLRGMYYHYRFECIAWSGDDLD